MKDVLLLSHGIEPTTSTKELHVGIGEGIAIAGVWIFAGMVGTSKLVTGQSVAVRIAVALVVTAAIVYS